MLERFLWSLLIVILSSLLWRIRGGLGERQGMKLPMNKIWYAIAFGIYCCFFYGFNLECWLIGFIDCYTSYQLYGWGKYVGAVTSSYLNKDEKECELIDDILDNMHITISQKTANIFNKIFGRWFEIHEGTYYLWDYPRLYGFLGTSLTGLMITFLWGLYLNSLWFMLSGLGMGLCYYVGHLVCDYIKDDGKKGWNWGEWIYGAYQGAWLAWLLLWANI